MSNFHVNQSIYVPTSGNKLGMAKFNSFAEDILSDFIIDGIDYMYDLEPQSNNLFFAGYFREGENGNVPIRPFLNSPYRIKGVKIPIQSMNFKVDPYTRLANVDTINTTQDVTLEWFEDVYHSVKKYHLDWMSRWYNRQYDTLRCGAQGKFRRMSLVAFHFNNKEEQLTSKSFLPAIEPIFILDIAGLVPENIGDFDFNYSKDGNDSLISIKYKASRISMFYNETFAPDNADAEFWSGATGQGAADIFTTGAQSDYQATKVDNEERLRISRSATSAIMGENVIG